jgi:hypothetical protein
VTAHIFGGLALLTRASSFFRPLCFGLLASDSMMICGPLRCQMPCMQADRIVAVLTVCLFVLTLLYVYTLICKVNSK